MVRGDRGTHLLGAEKRVRHMKLTTVFFPDSQTFAAPRPPAPWRLPGVQTDHIQSCSHKYFSKKLPDAKKKMQPEPRIIYLLSINLSTGDVALNR
jgi:hypothetical protein